MQGELFFEILIILIVGVVIFVCIRNAILGRMKDDASDDRPTDRPGYDRPTGRPVHDRPTGRPLTKNEQYIKEHDLWVCPECETYVSRSRTRCFICDRAKP